MTAKAARNRRSKTSVSLTLAAVATHATGTPSPSTATLYLVPRLARSVGLGPVRSPARLARTEQLSRIRSGWPRSTAWCTDRLVGVEELGGVGERPFLALDAHCAVQAEPGLPPPYPATAAQG